jgi:hypothetical protein
METLGGFPCLPAMVRAEQSSAAPHAIQPLGASTASPEQSRAAPIAKAPAAVPLPPPRMAPTIPGTNADPLRLLPAVPRRESDNDTGRTVLNADPLCTYRRSIALSVEAGGAMQVGCSTTNLAEVSNGLACQAGPALTGQAVY